MAHYQQHGQGHQQATRVDEYGNPIPGGHGILGQTGEYGAGAHGLRQTGAAGGFGRQAGYGPIGTGVHDDGGHGGSGQPAFGTTGTGIHDDGGIGGYGSTGTGPHVTGHGGAHGLPGTGTGVHTGGLGAGHTGMHGIPGMGTHDDGGLGTGGHNTVVLGATGTHDTRDTGMLGDTGLGTHGHRMGTGIAGTHGAEHKTRGILRRSGSSSSSSSSEDDGMGGRRKTGMKEKIKEKLPGGHKDNQYQQQSAATGGYGPDSAYTSATTGTGMGTGAGGTYAEGTHEKKGMMEKIKEKLPGGHKDEYGEQHSSTATGGYAPGRTGTTGTYGATEGTHEKKGIMEKIKEKLPRQH